MKLVIYAIALLASLWFGLTSSYIESKPRNVVIVDKMVIPGGYKQRSRPLLVYKLDTGDFYDRVVTITTYAQSRVGDNVVISVSKFDVYSTWKENVLYIFAPIICVAVFGLLLIVEFIIL